jgi:hypothetical protein
MYQKNGKDCFLCLTRKKLIQATPEESVRQAMIQKLLSDYNVPLKMIESEVPLSQFSNGNKGRADIIVYEYDEEYNVGIPLILIECKEKNVPLTDGVFMQAFSYDSELEAKLIIITNGKETIPLLWDEEKEDYLELQEIPQYNDLISNKSLKTKEETSGTWTRPNHIDIEVSIIEELLDEGFMGEDTDPKFHSFLLNLHGLIYDEQNKILNFSCASNNSIQDGGVRYTTFGNASGGSWAGYYRYLIIEDPNKNHEIISFSIMGKLSAKNHPKYGNSKGESMLLVAIDNYEKSHLSLELSLDRFTKIEENNYTIIHDGTLTVGKKGRAKNEEVLSFVNQRNPGLIKNGKVYLGSLDNSTELNWQRKDVIELFSNLIDYALIRDEFRKSKQSLDSE